MKKMLSILLAAVMLVSAVPTAFAADTQDHSLGTQVVFTAANNESYTITVPAKLNPGQSGTVTLDGMWPSDKTIFVTAESTVTLTNSILATDQKVLDVTFLGISKAGNDTAAQTFTETVSVESIENALFGTWSGKFNYNVESADGNIIAYSYNGTLLPKIPATSADYPYAYMVKLSGATLDKHLKDEGFAEYVDLVDVGYSIQYTTHPRPYDAESNELNFDKGTMKCHIYTEGLMNGWMFLTTTDASVRPTSWKFSEECKLIWSNTDVVGTDGSVYLAASIPVPVTAPIP